MASELPLPGPPAAAGTARDITVRVGPPVAEISSATGEVLADAAPAGYRVVRTASGVRIDFGQLAECNISDDLSKVELRAVGGVSLEWLALLVSGNVLAAVLALRGACVLHASVVEIEGAAIAIAGRSGVGKSTFAGLLCAAGARLVSDDVMRVDSQADGAINAYRGTSELRMRTGGQELAALLEVTARVTIDGRCALEPARSEAQALALAAVVLPRRGDIAADCVSRLSPRDALLELLALPRTLGWQSAEPNRAHFRGCAAVVERTPVAWLEISSLPSIEPTAARRIAAAVADLLQS